MYTYMKISISIQAQIYKDMYIYIYTHTYCPLCKGICIFIAYSWPLERFRSPILLWRHASRKKTGLMPQMGLHHHRGQALLQAAMGT